MSKRVKKDSPSRRRRFTYEFKRREAVQMLLDGHSATLIVERLGLSSVQPLYRWKREQLRSCGSVVASLKNRVKELALSAASYPV